MAKKNKELLLPVQKRGKYLKALQELELENNGIITPRVVVESAKSESSPLHKYFEWNDGEAAEKYRLYQARVLMTTVKVQMVGGKQQDAYFNAIVTIEEKPMRGYVPMDRALTDELIYKQVLANAARELRYWTNKYNSIQDLKEVVNKEKLEEVEKKAK